MKHQFPKIIYAASAVVLAVLILRFSTNGNVNQAGLFVYPGTQKTVQKAKDTPIQNLQDLDNALANIAASTNPSVVMIHVKMTKTVKEVPFDPFGFFGDNGQPQTRKYEEAGQGSGVIVSSDGYILTNNHVVGDADTIEVRMYNQNNYIPAKVIGTDKWTDLAVIKVNAKNLPAMKLGNSDDLRVGEMVMAVGSPLSPDLANTVTMGIVSAKGRAHIFNNQQLQDFIQTDAAINPGNSGGALINLNGELVGINSAIATQSGGNEGIGFAIPINMAKSVMDQIIKYGKVTRSYIGVAISNIQNSAMAQGFGLKKDEGALITSVKDGSPAAKAGLQHGDVVIKMNGKEVKGPDDLQRRIVAIAPGKKISLTVIRYGKQKHFEVTLGRMPDNYMSSSFSGSGNNNGSGSGKLNSKLGFSTATLNSDLANQFNIQSNYKGVVVTHIDHSSSAYDNGVRTGDLILEANHKRVRDVRDFQNVVSGLKKGDALVLRILRSTNSGTEVAYLAFRLQ